MPLKGARSRYMEMGCRFATGYMWMITAAQFRRFSRKGGTARFTTSAATARCRILRLCARSWRQPARLKHLFALWKIALDTTAGMGYRAARSCAKPAGLRKSISKTDWRAPLTGIGGTLHGWRG